MDTNNKSTPTPLPRDPQALLHMGLQLGHFIIAAVFDRPLNERTVPEPLPCSRTLTLKGGR